MDANTVAMVLSLFPTSDHREWAVGPYSFESDEAPLLADQLPTANPQSLELMTRRVFDTEEALAGGISATGTGMRLRLFRDATGHVNLDRFEMETVLMNVRVRPELGDAWEVALPGTWDEVWLLGDTGRMQWRIHSPLTLTLLGISKSDMDIENKAKWYVAGGAGIGGEVLARVAGPLGVQLRVDGEAQSRRRWGGSVHWTSRHELSAAAELGFSLFRDRSAWLLGAWGEHIWQLEPWDAGGRDGVDQAYFATGARLSARFYKDRELLPVTPEGPQFEGLLGAMDDVREATRDRDLLRREGVEVPEEEVTDLSPEEAPQEPAPWKPLEVHWSEVDVTTVVAPRWPENIPPEPPCEVTFFVDTTGVPYDIQAASCPSGVLPPVMEAAWGWRFAPIVDQGDTVSASFTYPISPTTLPEVDRDTLETAPTEE